MAEWRSWLRSSAWEFKISPTATAVLLWLIFFISCLFGCTEINYIQLYNWQERLLFTESTKDANSFWENFCESKSHPFFSLSSFWQMLQTSVKRKTCVFSFWISIVLPSEYWGTCDKHLYFWPPLRLVRHVLLFKRIWDSLVSEVMMSVRYLSSCLKISKCFCFLHLGKYHPPTYLLALKWYMLSWC